MTAPSTPGSPGSPGSRIIPCLRYRDAHAANDWLCRAFGFQRRAVQDYGGRGYACRDRESHLWWFGSCDPWREAAVQIYAGQPAATAAPQAPASAARA